MTAPGLATNSEREGGGTFIRLAQFQIIVFCIIGGLSNVSTAYSATFPVMLKAMRPDFGGSLTWLTLGFSAYVCSLAVMGPIVGRLVDRYGPRPIIGTGICGLALSLGAMGTFPPSLPSYFLISILIGLFGAGTFQFFYYGLLSYWFGRNLGLALGVAAAGTAAGLVIAPQLTDWLVRHHGWQSAFVTLGVLVAAIGLPNLLNVRLPPWMAARDKGAADLAGMTMAEVVHTVTFWQLVFCYFVVLAVINGNVVHFIAMLGDRGIGTAEAARSMAFLGVANFVGRLVSGVMLTRFRPALVGGFFFFLAAVGTAMLAGTSGLTGIAVAVVLLGLALGVEGEMLNFMSRHLFGLKAQGSILGALSTAFLIGMLAGPLALSVYRDNVGNYAGMQWLLVALCAVAAIVHCLIRAPRAAAAWSSPPSTKVS